jgi:hypothetical protein
MQTFACYIQNGRYGMAFVSVTRLRIRSLWYVLPFSIASRRSRRQLRQAPGFLEGRLTIEFPRAFWTMTIWKSQEDMRRFRNAPPHLEAMRHLPKWCDEASYVHWEQRDPQLPPIDDAYHVLRKQGTTSKVNHPTAAHSAGQTTSDKKPRPAKTFRGM